MADQQPQEDWELAFFRALRALRHLYFKHEKRETLDPECEGCKEIQDFVMKPRYRGNVDDPLGVEIHRPLTESKTPSAS